MNNAGSTSAAEVSLDSLTDPVSSTGHIVYVRAKVATGSGGVEKLTWYLYEGGNLRATSSATTISRTTITDYSYTLTSGEADAITAYTDLRVRFAMTTGGASENINVYEVWMEVPDAAVNASVTPTTVAATTAIDACNCHPELCDRRFDQVALAATHNSMSGGDIVDWMFPNQEKGIPAQLEDGIRGFLVDNGISPLPP